MAFGQLVTARPSMIESDFFAGLLEIVNDLVLAVSLDGQHLLYVNSIAPSIYARSLGELTSDDHTWLSAIHHDDQDPVREILQRLGSGEADRIERDFRIVRPDGELRAMQGTFCLIRAQDQTPCRIGCIAKDVTRRLATEQRLEEAKAIYHSLVESLPINVFRKDREGRIVYGNARYCRSLGKSLEELLGKTDHDLFSPPLAEKYRQDDRWVLQTGLPFHDIEEHVNHDGNLIYVEVLKAPVTDSSGRRVGIQGMFWDVSERKRAEEALRQAKEIAESASRAKSDFLANMSHEIRTPLNAILGMTELLLETVLESSQREYLQMVYQSSEALLNLINDILDFSKIEAGKLELEPQAFNLRERVGDTMRSLALRAHSKGLELALSIDERIPTSLVGDITRIRQVIVNLVSNAIKFTEAGEVILEVTSLELLEQNARLRFSVVDTGIGIPPDKLDRVFLEFEQADSSTTRKYGGTGLGLAIASRLVGLMGGELKVESEIGRGSRFYFDLQLPIDQETRAAGHLPDLLHVVVLIVDDNATNRRILEKTLSAWGMDPLPASSAKQALALLNGLAASGDPIPLVLSDVNMPDHDGYELAEWIRAQPALAETKIILLTSSNRQGDFQLRRELRIESQLLKPVKQSDLLEAVAQALGVASSLTPLEPTESNHDPSTSRTIQPLRILLAEDNHVNQRLAVGLLEKYGHHVIVAEDGEQAVKFYREGEFDLILMDVQMPRCDGLEATRQIRTLEQGTRAHVPIIAMTAHALVGDRDRCLAAGMDDFISKPIRIGHVLKVISEVTGTVAGIAPAAGERSAPLENGAVDWKAALDTVGGDQDLLRDLTQVFVDEAKSMLDDVRNARDSQQPKDLRRAAHSLKGALRHLGASQAAVVAQKLELAGETEDFGDVPGLCEKLAVEVAQVVAEFRKFIAT